MNSYRTSSGERLNQSTIDNLIRKAKAKKLQNHLDEFGYIFCEKCKKSGGSYFDCSHNISVKKCKENGETERLLMLITLLYFAEVVIKNTIN